MSLVEEDGILEFEGWSAGLVLLVRDRSVEMAWRAIKFSGGFINVTFMSVRNLKKVFSALLHHLCVCTINGVNISWLFVVSVGLPEHIARYVIVYDGFLMVEHSFGGKMKYDQQHTGHF